MISRNFHISLGQAILLTSVSLIIGCTSITQLVAPTESPLLKEAELSQKMAIARAKQIGNVQYQLSLDLTWEGSHYKGEQIVEFDLINEKTELGRDVYFDFQGGEVSSVQVDGIVVPVLRGPVFLQIPKKHLKMGRNKIVMQFTHPYSNTGAGLHMFTDPIDNRRYLYTNFEPFDASNMAPFFDQPDLKAPLELTVKAPAVWKVIGNTPVLRESREPGVKTWVFAKTAPISSYLYAVMAGPFHEWSDQYKNIPLKLYARESLAKYVPHKEWFKITKQGFAYFEKYFAVDYPFFKYDQIIVPEFNAGAMENVGAVTFTEKYIRRAGYTRSERMGMYNTVLHEMAHMWFGNLVTMKWWDDLWLNESFATYMATLAMIEATEFKESWLDFRHDKRDAYKQDQSLTTHPIAGEVANTNEAFSSFDDITYGKGASVMKELSYYLGADVFQRSLQEYFKTHAYRNTTLQDFIDAFERVTQKDMNPWFHSWLETTGVDTVSVTNECARVQVNFSERARPHAFQLVGYRFGKDRAVMTHSFDVKYEPARDGRGFAVDLAETKAARRTVSGNELPCPDFVYVNNDDHAYLKVALDDEMVQQLTDNIQKFSDPLMRVTLWDDLWQMVRDRKLPVMQFSNLALASLKVEKNEKVLSLLAARTVGARGGAYNSVYYFMPRSTTRERANYDKMNTDYEEVLLVRLRSAKGEMRLFFYDVYAQAARSPKALANVREWMAKMKDDPDRRWRGVLTLCREQEANIDTLLERELEGDKSDFARKNALKCRALRPHMKVKKEYLDKIIRGPSNEYSKDDLERISGSLFSPRHRHMMASFADEIYGAIENVWPNLDESYQEALADGLAPVYCDRAAHDRLDAFLKAHPSLPSVIRDSLLSRLDDDQYCLPM